MDLDRRIRDEEKGMGSYQFVGEGRKISVNKVETQKMDGQQLITDGVVNFGGNSMVAGNLMAGGNLIGGNPMVGGNPTIQNKINGATPPFLDHRRIDFQGVGTEGIHKKRKDMESNGVFHENEPRPRPNKMARHISNLSLENGRRINLPQSPSSSLLDKQGASQGASPNSMLLIELHYRE
nr:hypothetical protein [Tanacetum cinerariifolium]